MIAKTNRTLARPAHAPSAEGLRLTNIALVTPGEQSSLTISTGIISAVIPIATLGGSGAGAVIQALLNLEFFPSDGSVSFSVNGTSSMSLAGIVTSYSSSSAAAGPPAAMLLRDAAPRPQP